VTYKGLAMVNDTMQKYAETELEKQLLDAVTDETRFPLLEKIIDENIKSFYLVGCALREIRDRNLYKLQGFEAFEEYCQAHWDMGRRNANHLIGSANVVDNLKNNTRITHLPSNQTQTRPLVSLSSELQIEVWRRAVQLSSKNKKISEALIKRAIEEVLNKQTATTAAIKRTAFSLSESTIEELDMATLRAQTLLGENIKFTNSTTVSLAVSYFKQKLENGEINTDELEKILN